ncbi:MAG: hypothetical protein EOO50_12460 [Flavobacterium sp.]|uniref:hypothetical protein n=1 Tax=Flavobacterium sp. TaxID=239 RepID=UPI001206D171|nr:hypothetical protein [Flavobacterium sp.]RZJ65820.1 MAG: hypothetical protein EOO50_12460 [Flavobacterium sp.]
MTLKEKMAKSMIAIFISGIAGLLLYGYLIEKDAEKNGIVTVGKYVSHSRSGKHESNYFDYYISGKKYQADGGLITPGFEKNIGKFYEIKRSSRFTHIVNANYGNEIRDQEVILSAGFTVQEIER